MRAKFVNEAIKHLTGRSEEELSNLPSVEFPEFDYFTDMEDEIEEDEIEKPLFYAALKELGVDKEHVGVISEYGIDYFEGAYERAKLALSIRKIKYVEFNGGFGWHCVLFNINDIQK